MSFQQASAAAAAAVVADSAAVSAADSAAAAAAENGLGVHQNQWRMLLLKPLPAVSDLRYQR